LKSCLHNLLYSLKRIKTPETKKASSRSPENEEQFWIHATAGSLFVSGLLLKLKKAVISAERNLQFR